MGGASDQFSPNIVQKIYQKNINVWYTDNPIGNENYKVEDKINTPLGVLGGLQ
jgi:hypothetical protein